MKIAAPSGSAPTSTTLGLRLMTDASSKNVGKEGDRQSGNRGAGRENDRHGLQGRVELADRLGVLTATQVIAAMCPTLQKSITAPHKVACNAHPPAQRDGQYGACRVRSTVLRGKPRFRQRRST